jgi:hypothetical protein
MTDRSNEGSMFVKGFGGIGTVLRNRINHQYELNAERCLALIENQDELMRCHLFWRLIEFGHIQNFLEEDYSLEEELRDFGSQHPLIRGFRNFYPSSYDVENPRYTNLSDVGDGFGFYPRTLPPEGGNQWLVQM